MCFIRLEEMRTPHELARCSNRFNMFNSCETIQQGQTCIVSRGPLLQHQSMDNKATAVWRGCLHCFIVSLTSRSMTMMKLLIPSVYEKLFAIRDPHVRLLIITWFIRILIYTLIYYMWFILVCFRCPVFRGLCGAVWSDAVAVEPRIFHPVMVHLGNSATCGWRVSGGTLSK